MKDRLQEFLAPPDPATETFPANSRYHGLGTRVHVAADGTRRVYVARRLVPPPERFALLEEHSVVLGDRLDKLAAEHLGDPEQYWRLCDANGALRPDALVDTVGSTLRITLPEGIPGSSDG